MGASEAVCSTKLALVFVLVGFVIHIIGFGAPYWSKTSGYSAGLWQYCLLDSCSDADFNTDQLGFGNWFQAVRTFECFGLIGSIAVIVFLLIFLCVGSCSSSKCMAILNIILALGTGVVILIAIIIYASESGSLSWAFGLATAGGVCFVMAGIFLILSICR